MTSDYLYKFVYGSTGALPILLNLSFEMDTVHVILMSKNGQNHYFKQSSWQQTQKNRSHQAILGADKARLF